MIAVLIAGLSTAVMAAEEGGEGGSEGTTTTISSGLIPAVDIAPDETAPPQADWTYRYIVPTALALAVVIIVITAIKYFTDVVRKRYRIVEE
jgi:hypothetical protein